MRNLIVCLLLPLATVALAEESGLPELTPEQLEQYQFENPRADRAVVKDINVGQQYILNAMRREIKDLLARKAGILKLNGNADDLALIQLIVDRDLITDRDTRGWQSLGVVFGDVLAHEHDLSWVSYEDDQGVSKALRWRESDNFVFPVTVFSKRVYFGERIDAAEIYAEISAVIDDFKRAESLRPGG